MGITKQMRVLFAASEVTPYASTGGLAEVAAALPKALAARGVETCRVMPMYRRVVEGGFELVDLKLKLEIPVGLRSYTAEVWRTASEAGPLTYFIRRDEFFDRSQLYSLSSRDYDDNFERFVFFQKAVVALIDRLHLAPDVVHLNDWQTGLLPYFLRHGIEGGGRSRKEKTVLTLHNLAYQGIFSGNEYSLTNLPFSCFSVATMEYYGNLNCLKGGLTGADRITTVSKTYANEIQTAAAGCGLEGVLASVKDRLVGIVNGIDTQVWNPATDRTLASSFTVDKLDGKAVCKTNLIAKMHLRCKPNTPVLGMITRLVDQKGLDILAAAMPEIMKRDLAFVLLGTGEERYEQLCQNWANMWPGKFGFKLAYDTKLAHRIMAGSDIFLMPSKFEPCGLNQLYGMRYGAVPVVHAVGGLEDTVDDLDASGDKGYGIKFRDYTSSGLVAALERALSFYGKPSVWTGIVRRAMKQDFSWDRSSQDYLDLYQALVGP